MRLLFDENLSPSLTYLLTNEYPGSEHVRDAARSVGRPAGGLTVAGVADRRPEHRDEAVAPELVRQPWAFWPLT